MALLSGIILLFTSYIFLLKYFFSSVNPFMFFLFFILSFLTLFFISYSIYVLFNFMFSNISFVEILLINILSTVLSFYIFFAPGGLGVKEYLIVFLLNYFGFVSIYFLLLAIMHRIIVIFGELIIYVFCIIFKKRLMKI